MISKWTLKIRDKQIWKDFTLSRVENVICIMKGLLVYKSLFLLSNVVGLFTDRLANVPRFGISMVSCLVAAIPFVLTMATKKTVFIKWGPLFLVLFHSIADNYLIYYLFSEEGVREGKEQFGDDYAQKLSQLVITLRDNITMTLGVATLLGTEWFPNTISSTIFFIAQILMEYQLSKHETKGNIDSVTITYIII